MNAVEAGADSASDDVLSGQRWILVEDSEFLPARGGGEQEHLGMLRAARDAGVLSAVVLPVSGPINESRYAEAAGGAPIVTVCRRRSAARLLHPRYPYTVASRLPDRELVSRVSDVAADATGVVITSYKSWVIGRTLAQRLGLPAVIRMHNREGAYHRSLAEGSRGLRRPVLRWEAMRIERDERRLAHAPWLAGVADISNQDATWRAALGPVPVRPVPPFAGNGLAPITRHPAYPPEVLFVGALDVATNVDSIRWLLDDVWPLISRSRPDATLRVVGRAPSADLRGIVAAAPATVMCADVATVAPFLSQASVAVNPAVTGSGVNIKLVEYLQAAIPVVSTSHATAGLDLVGGHDLLIADRPTDFAQAVNALLADSERARAMGLRGQAAIRRLVDVRAGLQQIAVLLQSPRDQTLQGRRPPSSDATHRHETPPNQ